MHTMQIAKETLTQLKMTFSPDVHIWKIGKISIMEFVDLVGKTVTIVMGQIHD